MLKSIVNRLKQIFNEPYPKVVSQTVLKSGRIDFKVHNLIEEDRITGSNSEIEFTQEILNEIGDGEVYFDIGSCIGFTAISAAKNSGCKVFAFEPDKELAQHLLYNITLNGLEEKIKVNQWAVSDNDGFLDFYTSGANGASPSLAKTQNQNKKVKLEAHKIDTAISNRLLEPPDVIKIDIEGAELMALKGMYQTLLSNQCPRTIFIETHPPFMALFGHDVGMLQQFLKECHYREVYMKQRGDENHHKFSKL